MISCDASVSVLGSSGICAREGADEEGGLFVYAKNVAFFLVVAVVVVVSSLLLPPVVARSVMKRSIARRETGNMIIPNGVGVMLCSFLESTHVLPCEWGCVCV